jgi:hypothetical protein
MEKGPCLLGFLLSSAFWTERPIPIAIGITFGLEEECAGKIQARSPSR